MGNEDGETQTFEELRWDDDPRLVEVTDEDLNLDNKYLRGRKGKKADFYIPSLNPFVNCPCRGEQGRREGRTPCTFISQILLSISQDSLTASNVNHFEIILSKEGEFTGRI